VIPIVLDTGVLVKVVVQEEDSPKAVALFDAAVEGSYRLLAPDFMAIEFGNVLWKYVKRAVLREDEARRFASRWSTTSPFTMAPSWQERRVWLWILLRRTRGCFGMWVGVFHG